MRVKQFDPNDALDKAMLIFWSRGYEATSMQDLQDAMSIQRQSLYNTFESKHSLFLASLRHYHNNIIVPNFSGLFSSSSPLKAIRSYFSQRIKDVDNPNVINGCFATNSVAELGLWDEAVREQTRKTLNYMESGFRAAIEQAQDIGEIDPSKDSRALAALLLNSAQGLFVLGKSGMSSKKLKTIADQILLVLTREN